MYLIYFNKFNIKISCILIHVQCLRMDIILIDGALFNFNKLMMPRFRLENHMKKTNIL